MKKNRLEEKILNKVYGMETRKTSWYIVSRILSFLFISLIAYIFISVLFDIFAEQKTLDLVNFSGDDLEVVGRYLIDNVKVFLEETPREILGVLALTITVLVYLCYKIIINFRKIKNKVVSIYKFYKNKK